MYTLETGSHWSMGRQLAILQILVVAFSFLSSFGMLITYVVRLRGQMAYLVIENLNLFNKMHEGLIVVDEEDITDLKFATTPAVKLLK